MKAQRGAALLLTVVLIGALGVAVLGGQSLIRQLGYMAVRDAFAHRTVNSGADHELRSRSVDVYYPPGHRGDAELTLDEARSTLGQVEYWVGYDVPAPVPFLVEPSQAAIQKAVGLTSVESVVGVYYRGVVYVLAPSAWASGSPGLSSAQVFDQQGPVPHELTHYVLDAEADGNFPSWYTEGLAQFVDRKITGYLWLTPRNDLTQVALYSLQQLDISFYSLPNQALAYREAYSLVALLEQRRGVQGLHALDAALGKGVPFAQAVVQADGISESALMDLLREQIAEDPSDYGAQPTRP